MVLTEEEQRLQKEPFEVITFSDEDSKIPQKSMKVVVELTGSRRESKSKDYEYEVNLKGQYIHGLLLFDNDLYGIRTNQSGEIQRRIRKLRVLQDIATQRMGEGGEGDRCPYCSALWPIHQVRHTKLPYIVCFVEIDHCSLELSPLQMWRNT